MPHSLPAALAPLAAYRQFILCQLAPDPARIGKTHKYPLHPATLHKHNPHDPAIWMTHDETAAQCETLGPDFMCGFVITREDPFFFVDLDNCLTDDGWSAESQRIAGLVPGAAIEVSQSGQGLHILGSYDGAPPAHSCAPAGPDRGFYTEGRFVALTGWDAVGDVAARPALGPLIAQYFPPGADMVDGDWTTTPVPEWGGAAMDDDALIARACASGSVVGAFTQRATFADLWRGDEAALGRTWPGEAGVRAYDASLADGALAGHLAFWTGKNCARIEALMLRSGLARDKYERRDGQFGTYLRRTILGAVARCSAVYGERQPATPKVNEINSLSANSGSQVAGLSFTAAAGGLIAATVANVESALLSDESGVTIARDDFRNRLCIREGNRWRLFKDTDYGFLRAALERRGFKPVPSEVIKTVVGMVADKQSFDSAKERVEALQWDGVPRVTTSMVRYYGVADTPYSRAVGEYLFTALAGRSMRPGCQADMAVILIGVQGDRKTSAVMALALEKDHFGSIDLSNLDAELAKKLRGKTVLEWAELRGLAGRDKESIKDWITRRTEEFRDLYQTFPEPYERRCIEVGTGNDVEILDDPSGERRWLPLIAGQADVEALEADIEQLWAEGAAMWRQGGIRWYEAERLAKMEHFKFKVGDVWTERVAQWLDDPVIQNGMPLVNSRNSDKPVALIDVLQKCLNFPSHAMTRRDELRVGKIMRALGYEKKNVEINGKQATRWIDMTRK